MAKKLTKDIIDLIHDPATTTVLATLDGNGFPEAVVTDTIRVDEHGNLLYLELLESSGTNRNLVRSIWFNGRVAVAVGGKAGERWQIKGRPVKTHITGDLFLQHYQEVREQRGDVELAAVWVIEPDEVADERFETRKSEEERAHPSFRHLDRLARTA
ncbi:hypothetical protein [Geobacter pickeringii]|uniref:Pyridoxamine 5'-phosphate oxidase putative domain-containing protein n=1 Tax=Geobacter pickeringii TaxID=345632 RepID=A0A0B5BDK5_9BACT|nr:hypothetical protein [Geobacter pickeringii]AJE02161.1 hypothetical protein GPICK_01115 [Geobacter pickeringii]